MATDWDSHHHLMTTAGHVTGRIRWATMHLLLRPSLVDAFVWAPPSFALHVAGAAPWIVPDRRIARLAEPPATDEE